MCAMACACCAVVLASRPWPCSRSRSALGPIRRSSVWLTPSCSRCCRSRARNSLSCSRPLINVVTPPELFGESGGRAPDIWAPLMLQPQFERGQSYLDQANLSWLRVIARLRPGASEEQAQAFLATLLGQIKSEPSNLGKWAG